MNIDVLAIIVVGLALAVVIIAYMVFSELDSLGKRINRLEERFESRYALLAQPSASSTPPSAPFAQPSELSTPPSAPDPASASSTPPRSRGDRRNESFTPPRARGDRRSESYTPPRARGDRRSESYTPPSAPDPANASLAQRVAYLEGLEMGRSGKIPFNGTEL